MLLCSVSNIAMVGMLYVTAAPVSIAVQVLQQLHTQDGHVLFSCLVPLCHSIIHFDICFLAFDGS